MTFKFARSTGPFTAALMGLAALWASVPTDTLADGFSLTGNARLRTEALQGQFRSGQDGGDQLILLRTLVHGTAEKGPWSLGVELQDSRTYGADLGTPLSSGIANPLDILQAYGQFDNGTTRLTLGRQTVSIGSKRQIERIQYANVIKSYTGAHLTHQRGEDELHLVYVVPTGRFPNTRPDLDDNVLSGDEEQWGRQIWGVHYRRANLLGTQAPGLWGEAFVYGLSENDTDRVATPDREYVTPGIRIHRRAAPGQWDIDLEAAYRFGSRKEDASTNDIPSLSVSASMAWLAAGYTWDRAWTPRFAVEYYWASGDDDPNDDKYGQYERLFGSRRGDLNNTSIHGPLTPANLNAPGFRIEVTPNDRWDGRLYYSAAHLASETDSWVIAKHRDPTGQSGSFIGHTLDGRARYWVLPDRLRLEVGASALLFGEFAEQVAGGPEGDGTLYGYGQLTLQF